MLFILNKSPLLRAFVAALTLGGASLLAGCGGGESQQIGGYSVRHYNTDKELYNRFTNGRAVELMAANGWE